MTSLNRPIKGQRTTPAKRLLGPELAAVPDEGACGHSACQPCREPNRRPEQPNVDCRSIAVGVMLDLPFRLRSLWPPSCPQPSFAVSLSTSPCLPRCASFSLIASPSHRQFVPS